MTNEQKLNGCKPDLIRKVLAVISDLQGHGYKAQVVQGLRTQAEQDEAVRTGHSLVQHSKHQDGEAADLVFLDVKGRAIWSGDYSGWGVLGRSARAHGLIWGGDWVKLKDLGHVELP